MHPASQRQSSYNGEVSGGGGVGDSRSGGDGAGCRDGSGGRRRSRVSSDTPASQPSPSRSKDPGKRARRTTGSDQVRPVEVKREEPVDRVADDEEAGASSSSLESEGAGAAVVKTEDIEVACKVEPLEAADAAGDGGLFVLFC